MHINVDTRMRRIYMYIHIYINIYIDRRTYCLRMYSRSPSTPLLPHAVIAMCSWNGRRTQPYACKRQDVFLASDSFGLIICARHHPLRIITSRNNKHLHTTYGGMRRACTRKQMTTTTVAETPTNGFGSNRNETTPA